MARKSTGKAQRFRIFSRDNFTCRYCGRQSDVVPLQVDHVIPVCQGGTNDDENLITACVDCNGGKGGRTIAQTVPTEADRLRLAQERNEQVSAAQAAQAAAQARHDLERVVINYWCGVTGRDSVERQTLSVVMHFVKTYGAELVYEWIDKAYSRTNGRDSTMGRYISGIRRNYEKDREAEAF